MNPAKQYVEMIATAFPAQRNFVVYLERGKEFTLPVRSVLSAKDRAYVRTLVRQCGGSFAIKQCYFNAQMLLDRDHDERLRYWEGWACNEHFAIPVHHAWVTINGKVVDVTVQALRRTDNAHRGKWLYFGMEIPRMLVMKNRLLSGLAEPITESAVAREAFGIPRV